MRSVTKCLSRLNALCQTPPVNTLPPSLYFFCRAWRRAALPVIIGAVSVSSVAHGATLLVNGTFDAGAARWSMLGGASVIVTGEPLDNPYARVPDGALAMLYQEAATPVPQLLVSFDYFTGFMSPLFPSPGAFPDTAFASLFFGADEAAVQPELFLSGSLVGLFDYDARSGLSALLAGATTGPSPARAGWSRFSALVDVPDGQPWFALTFQNFNANGTAADSAFLVDNLEVFPIPEPAAPLLMLTALLLLPRRRQISASF